MPVFCETSGRSVSAILRAPVSQREMQMLVTPISLARCFGSNHERFDRFVEGDCQPCPVTKTKTVVIVRRQFYRIGQVTSTSMVGKVPSHVSRESAQRSHSALHCRMEGKAGPHQEDLGARLGPNGVMGVTVSRWETGETSAGFKRAGGHR